MNNQQGEGAGGVWRGSFWGCALDDTLYHVGCC